MIVRYKNRAESTFCWFFEKSSDKTPLGFVLYTEDEEQGLLYLEAIEVHPSKRSQGYSRKFLEFIKSTTDSYYKESFSWRDRGNFTKLGLQRIAPAIMSGEALEERLKERPDVLSSTFVKDWEGMKTYL